MWRVGSVLTALTRLCVRHAPPRRYELAWITAHAFTGQTPRFVALDDIQFLQPVSVGSIVHLSSVVEYAQGEAPPHVSRVPSV